MNTNSPLPGHLERIGDQLISAAEDLHAAGLTGSRRRVQQRRGLAMLARAPRLALASCLASVVAVVAVVAVFATTGTPPAYALTQNANGTYTVTISDIATGVPALNAKLQQLGIDATAVPVTATCSAPIQIGGPGAMTERMEEALAPANNTSGSEGLFNLDPASIPSGSEGVIAAYQAPSGQIGLTFWTTSGSPPSCLNARTVVPPSPTPNNQP